MSDNMIDAIRSQFGNADVTYVENKHRGGQNGSKGTRYEDYFIVAKIVEAAASLADDWSAENPYIQGQFRCFVDDALIKTNTATNYYQLKNKVSVSWDSGDRPLKQDFEKQYKLSKDFFKEPNPTTNIVVSCSELAQKLQESIPVCVKDHSYVHHFPWKETPNKLVQENLDIKNNLSKLAYSSELDILSAVFCSFIASYLNNPNGAYVKDFVEDVRKMYPCQLRFFPSTLDLKKEQLEPQFQNILDRIQGLTYGVERGVFHWFGFGMSGFFGTDHKSKSQFEKFQNQIIEKEPKEFDEFEEILNDIQYGEELP